MIWEGEDTCKYICTNPERGIGVSHLWAVPNSNRREQYPLRQNRKYQTLSLSIIDLWQKNTENRRSGSVFTHVNRHWRFPELPWIFRVLNLINDEVQLRGKWGNQRTCGSWRRDEEEERAGSGANAGKKEPRAVRMRRRTKQLLLLFHAIIHLSLMPRRLLPSLISLCHISPSL